MRHRFSVLVSTAALLMACSINFGGLPSGKAGLSVGGPSLARAISDEKDTISLSGIGPMGINFEERDIESGQNILALDPGSWTFTVFVKDAAGVVLQEDTQIADLIAGTITTLNFTVHTRGTVSGRVLDEVGSPLTGATLWVAELGTSPPKVASTTLVTDASGEFSAEDLPRGRLQVFVMDLAVGTTPPTTGAWWKPWIIEADQTGKVTLGDSQPMVSKMYFQTQTPSSEDLSEVPLRLVSVDSDSDVEWVWSNSPSAMAYFFSSPDAESSDKYLIRSDHELYAFGTEPSHAHNYTIWFRYESEQWVFFTSVNSNHVTVNNGGPYPGVGAKIIVHMKNSNDADLFESGGSLPAMTFSVTGPGILGATNFTHDRISTGELVVADALPGIYTFTPLTGGTSSHYHSFSVEVLNVGELVEQDVTAYAFVNGT